MSKRHYILSETNEANAIKRNKRFLKTKMLEPASDAELQQFRQHTDQSQIWQYITTWGIHDVLFRAKSYRNRCINTRIY